MSADSIEKLAQKLAESLPAHLKSARDEVSSNFQRIIRAGIEKHELVTREEFAAQREVLQRTRQKLAALETRLKDLESDRK